MNIEIERLKEQVTKYEKVLLSTAQKIEPIITKNGDKAVQEKPLNIWLKEISAGNCFPSAKGKIGNIGGDVPAYCWH